MSDERLAETFVELADTLVDDFDLIEFWHLLVDRCATLLDIDAAGLLIADPPGELAVVAASDEQARPPDLATAQRRWPQFTAAATRAGFAAVSALPMRLRTEVIGTLTLFLAAPADLDPPRPTDRSGFGRRGHHRGAAAPLDPTPAGDGRAATDRAAPPPGRTPPDPTTIEEPAPARTDGPAADALR